MNGIDFTWVTAYECDCCGELALEPTGESLYECSECGTRFNREGSYDGGSHRCPECCRFAAKVGGDACPACGDGNLEEVEAVCCSHCQEVMTEEEWEEHATAWLSEVEKEGGENAQGGGRA